MNRSVAAVMMAIFAVVACLGVAHAGTCGACSCPKCATTNAAPCKAPCDTDPCARGMDRKFMRGVTNVFTGWMEIPAQISRGYKRQCFYGATVGVLTGVWYAAGRTFSGIYDMAGFWAADPENNDGVGIPLDSEYVWDEGCHHSMIEPKYSKATIEPFGRKLARGLGNGAFGLLEVPGQMMKGMKCNSWDLGMGKALWYFLSREFDGVFDVATSPLPNPCNTLGCTFEEEWPWQAALADRWW